MRLKRAFPVLALIFLLVSISSQASAQDAGNTEWFEQHSFTGNCTTQNVYNDIVVNDTVVHIQATLNWTAGDVSANLELSVRDSIDYVVNASARLTMPEEVNITEFENRGQWKFIVTPNFCGEHGIAYFRLNVTILHRILPTLELDSPVINSGGTLTLDASSDFTDITHYMYDLDGETTSWLTSPEYEAQFNNSGAYGIRVRIRYADGLESEWSEPVEVTVASEDAFPSLWPVLVVGIAATFFVRYLTERRLAVAKRKAAMLEEGQGMDGKDESDAESENASEAAPALPEDDKTPDDSG